MNCVFELQPLANSERDNERLYSTVGPDFPVAVISSGSWHCLNLLIFLMSNSVKA